MTAARRAFAVAGAHGVHGVHGAHRRSGPRRWPAWLVACVLGATVGLPAAHALPVAAQRSPFPIERGDHSRIDYYLERRAPSGRGGTLLVVLQGSDCNSVTRIDAIHRDLAAVLPDADRLTIEKYGITAALPYSDETERPDCPAAYLLHDTPMQRARDAAAVVGRLAAEHGYARVVVLGGSEGAVVANLLAARSPRIDAIIGFGGGGRWFLDDVLHSIAASDLPAGQRVRAVNDLRGMARHLARGGTVPAMSDHGAAWWRTTLGIDQLAVLRTVRAPVLLIQGGADASASTADLRRMVDALARPASGPESVRLRVYPALDHRLRGPDGVSQMDRVAVDMMNWLREQGIVE
jgi:hypothetical protein